MKGLKILLVIMAAALLTIGLSGVASAFHSGGVAECDGCHTMHNSWAEDGSFEAPMTDPVLPVGQTYAYLLQGPTQSDTCLICHEHAGDTGPSSYHISTASSDLGAGVPPKQRPPGGDFAWVKKDFSWYLRGSVTEHGERHGHNIVATSHGYVADIINTAAPGASGSTAYSGADLHCTSCHDPHGRYRRNANGTITTTGLPIYASGSYNTSIDPSDGSGSVAGDAYAVGVYRFLGGVDYAPRSYQSVPFSAGPPAAIAPSTYNRVETNTDTRVAYGSHMSEWCGNCHGKFVENSYATGATGHTHPAGDSALLSATAWLGPGNTISDNYNAYLGSGYLTGVSAGAFTSLVPFETGSTVGDTSGHTVAIYDNLQLSTKSGIAGIANAGTTGSDRVMCLSCHRAHASGWLSMVRWPMEYEIMFVNATYPGTDATAPSNDAKYAKGRTVAETSAGFHNKPVTRFGASVVASADGVASQRSLCNKCHAKD